MIYDCFTFFNEIDLLEVRIRELDPIVDKFVIIEAKQTHTGKRKTLIFPKNKKLFQKYQNKIIYIAVDLNDAPDLRQLPGYIKYSFSEKNPKIWSREVKQRNSISLALKSAKPNDIILISDIDEIPSITSVKKISKGFNEVVAFKQKLFYYYFNYQADIDWFGTKAVLYKNLTTPQEIRMSDKYTIINNGGWHFSFMGGIENIMNKIKSYGHQEYNNDHINNKKRIEFCIKNNFDIFERPIFFKIIKNYQTLPKSISKNTLKYSKFFKKNTIFNRNTTLLQNEVNLLRKQNNDIIRYKEQEICSLNSQLNEIKNSHLFLLWPIYNKIKKILKK